MCSEGRKEPYEFHRKKRQLYYKLLADGPPYVHSVDGALGEQISRVVRVGPLNCLHHWLKSRTGSADSGEHKYTLGPAGFMCWDVHTEDKIGLSKDGDTISGSFSGDRTGENASFSMLINGKAILILPAKKASSLFVLWVMFWTGTSLICRSKPARFWGAYQERKCVIRKRLMEETDESVLQKIQSCPQRDF